MDPLNSLAQGNRFQRAYHRWALPHYERIGRDDPALRERVELVDRFLYSRQGLMAWMGWWVAGVAVAALLVRLGMPLGLAGLVTGSLWIFFSLALLGAWLNPQLLAARGGWSRFVPRLLLGSVVGGLLGWMVGHVMRHGWPGLGTLLTSLGARLYTLVPALAAAALGLMALFWGVARLSAQVQTHRLAQAALRAERDAAARAATEAELRLLQAQIHPHFIFNALATLQHWVDKQDPRAGPLLRELNGFLRHSTDMLGHATVPLGDEAQAVRHYLAILQARLGERLRVAVDIPPALAAQAVPTGLLLTLVENAVEHGIEPKIGGGSLSVRAERHAEGHAGHAGAWQLCVEDDGVGLAPDAVDHVGLSNVRLRLRHHFGPRAQLHLRRRPEGGTQACIEVETA